jgi:hypothetical protein
VGNILSLSRSCLASGIKKNIVENELTIPPGVVGNGGKTAILQFKELVRR